MAKLKITNTEAATGQIHDRYTGPEYINGAYVGGTGGLTSQTGLQIAPTVKVGTATAGAGSILAQKGTRKFRVTDGTVTGTCALVNLATPTADNTMSIQVNVATLSGATITSWTASTSTVAYVTGFTQTGPATLAAGQVVTGTGFTGTVTIGSIVSASNIALSYTSQTNANLAGVAVSSTVNASRITNRYVYDFGTATANPTKYRYHLATPDSTFVEVKSA
jgi:hypothetical protein